MTVFVEVAPPFQWLPFFNRNLTMYRFGWLHFSVGVLRIPFTDYHVADYVWREVGGDVTEFVAEYRRRKKADIARWMP